MIAPLVFSRPELLTEGVKEPITDSQGTLHSVMGQGVGWGGIPGLCHLPSFCFLCPGPVLPWHSPTPLPIGFAQLVAIFVPESQELAACSPWLLSPRPQRGIPGTLLWTRA